MQKAAPSTQRILAEQQVRRAHLRGAMENEWLQARFSFSFADYQDPNHVHWGSLRALNEDWVAPGGGFARHGHRDIETLTYPLQGRIHHTDSLGNDFEFGRGEILRMSAGTGIEHSEMNASRTEPERHLQIWLYPRTRGVNPGCALTRVDEEDTLGRWCPIASPDGREGSATVQQNAVIFASRPAIDGELDYQLAQHRLGYLHVVSGEVQVDPGLLLRAGDGLRFTHREHLALIAASADAEVLLFDL
ncbi:pirin family protein [Variovorax sp. J22R24]|uniref:pirin family protein n=1 Tax=Variovorax gracilis TaxID=3053502 RepID=UPI0025778709|nr:pirin family protein [Variovorax sp. J22R24]MDM0107619.1 pirin family protein [Variovorax sp. J22R24]